MCPAYQLLCQCKATDKKKIRSHDNLIQRFKWKFRLKDDFQLYTLQSQYPYVDKHYKPHLMECELMLPIRTTYLVLKAIRILTPTASLIFTAEKLFHQVKQQSLRFDRLASLMVVVLKLWIQLMYVARCKMFKFYNESVHLRVCSMDWKSSLKKFQHRNINMVCLPIVMICVNSESFSLTVPIYNPARNWYPISNNISQIKPWVKHQQWLIIRLVFDLLHWNRFNLNIFSFLPMRLILDQHTKSIPISFGTPESSLISLAGVVHNPEKKKHLV